MMQELVKHLHEGHHTLVVSNHGEMRAFNRRGVADLLELLCREPQFLAGALIADKVVGKAAASLMIKGRIAQLHTDTISRPALELFKSEGFEQIIAYETIVPHVENRTHDGWCPLERLCFDKTSIDEMVCAIRNFVEKTSAHLSAGT